MNEIENKELEMYKKLFNKLYVLWKIADERFNAKGWLVHELHTKYDKLKKEFFEEVNNAGTKL